MKKLGIFLLILSFILLGTKKEIEKNNINYQNKIIKKIYDNKNYSNEYLGYIEIPKYNIKRVIKNGVTKDVLDKNYVGLMNESNNLIILAGHNINLVFHKIHYLKKDDLIYLKMNKKNTYKVVETKEISIEDKSIIYKKYNTKTLILITCTKNPNKRFIVRGENVK